MPYLGVRPADITSATQVETDKLNVDNLQIDGNTLSSTDTNGDINLDPNGTGDTIIASGNLGIGETSPSRNLVIKDTDGQVDIGLVSSNSGVSALMFADTDDSNIGRIQYLHSTNDLTITTNDSEKIRILSGGGITFNADTAAANALDDYEEGTWTPTDNSGAGLSFTNGDGYYTKVGRQVFAAFRLTYPSTSDTNMASIAGLPFTAGNITDAMFGGSSTYHQDSGIGQPFSFLVADNGSFLAIFYDGSSQRGNNSFSGKPLRGFVIYNV